MENHIYMVKYGELVNVQAGVQIQVDPCMNGDVMTDRLSLLSHAFLSIPKESPYILKFPENLLGTRKSRFENFDKFREIIMGGDASAEGTSPIRLTLFEKTPC